MHLLIVKRASVNWRWCFAEGNFLINVEALSRACPHSVLELPGHADGNEEVDNGFLGTMFSPLLGADSSQIEVPGTVNPHGSGGQSRRASLHPPPLSPFFP